MRKRINKRVKDKWGKPLLVVLIALFTITGICLFDRKASADKTKDYAQKDPKPEENARKSIPVEYDRFVELMSSYRHNHVNAIDLGEPEFVEDENLIRIPLTKGKILLTGKNTDTEWCNDSVCFFHTVIINDSVTVVSCPADLMARLVEDFER